MSSAGGIEKDGGAEWKYAGRALRLALRILGVGVAATMVGTALAVYRGDGSSINAFLFLDLGLSHQMAKQVERIAIAAVTLSAVLALVWPRWFLLAPVALYLLAEAVAGTYVRGYAFSELTPAAHAPRYLAPLALAWLAESIAAGNRTATATRTGAEDADASTSQSRSLAAAEWILRIGLAAAFIAHGYEAYQLHPEFVDLIITTGQNLLGMRIGEGTASIGLRVIGVLDIGMAALLLIRPWRAVLVWMLVWGLVTAASRMTSYGWGAHTDLLMRCTHFVVPLALLLMVSRRSRPTAWLTTNPVGRSAEKNF